MKFKQNIKKIILFPMDILEIIYSKIFRLSIYVLKYKPTYDEDGLFTNHNCDFMKDPLFKKSYDLGYSTDPSNSWHSHWRVYTLCYFASLASNKSGDFVECGTNRGMSARAIINYVGFSNLKKKFYLMDTFNGLVDEYKSENEQKTNLVNYNECYEEVRERFADFSNVIIIRGSIPGTLSQVQSKEIALVHIDMNCAKPEIDAGEYFWEKIVASGVILLDDYAYPGYIDQKYAWDDFAKRKGIQILTLPTGQGLIIKP
jgi:O-methyltransferase